MLIDENDLNICNDDDFEVPKAHYQINGKTNNVTFSTTSERIKPWKNFLGTGKTTLMKENVIKVIWVYEPTKSCNIKVNCYNSVRHAGTVLIQGIKFVEFSDKFFKTLQNRVNKIMNNETTLDTDNTEATDSPQIISTTNPKNFTLRILIQKMTFPKPSQNIR